MRAGAVNLWYSKRADEEVTSCFGVIWNNKIDNWAEDFHFNFQEAYPFQYMWKCGAFFTSVWLRSNLKSQGHGKNWESGILIYLFIHSCKTSTKIMCRYHWGICSIPLYFLLRGFFCIKYTCPWYSHYYEEGFALTDEQLNLQNTTLKRERLFVRFINLSKRYNIYISDLLIIT